MTKQQAKNEEIDLSGMLWTPDNDTENTPQSKEDVEKIHFDKDVKKQGMHSSQQHAIISKTLNELSCIPKDVFNILTKNNSNDVINACEFAEQRGFSSLTILGKMVNNVRNNDAIACQLIESMGNLWDKTDYTYLDGQSIENVNQLLQKELQKAYATFENLENKWDDRRCEAASKNNEKAIMDWVDTHTLPLTKAIRELHYLVNKKRVLEEDKIGRFKYSSLGAALKEGDIQEFTRMLKNQKYDITNHAESETLNKLMAYTIKNGLTGAVAPLAEAGADVNALDNFGRTFFMQAIDSGRLDLAKELKNHGAIIRQKDLNGMTELSIAAKGGFVDIMKYLVEELKMDTTDTEYGINASCWKGYTALVYAAYSEQKDAVDYLLSKGANPTHEVWYEGNATPDCYTEDPEIETILLAAKDNWNKSHISLKSPKP